MNKIKVSNYQLMILTSGFVFGSAPLLISSDVTHLAKQDAWLSSILATIIGLMVVWINTYLGGLYPQKTLIEAICTILGKWLGGFVAAFYIFVAFVTTAQIVWYVGDFITTVYTPQAPSYMINVLFVTVIVIAMLYGLEAMFRATEIFFLTLFPLYIISMLMVSPNIKPDNLLPVLENGIAPVLKGTIPMLSYTVFLLIFLNMIYPVNTKNLKKAKKSIFYGYLLGMLTAFIEVLMCILVFGAKLTSNLRFPLFVLTQEINIGTIFTRLEALMLIIWLTTNFISAFICFYAGTIGLIQLFKLNNYKRIVLPLGLIVAIFSDFIYKNVPYEIYWDTYVLSPLFFTLGFILPVLLIVVYAVRKRLKKAS